MIDNIHFNFFHAETINDKIAYKNYNFRLD